MAPQLCRRHCGDCEAGRSENSESGQFEEGRIGWKRCAYLIHSAGSIPGKFSRQPTRNRDWEYANSVAAAWESAGSWPKRVLPRPEPAPVLVPTSARTTVKEVIEAYLGRCKSRGIQALNLARHKTPQINLEPIPPIKATLPSANSSSASSASDPQHELTFRHSSIHLFRDTSSLISPRHPLRNVFPFPTVSSHNSRSPPLVT